MNYFTRDRYLAMQRTGEADMDVADAEWEDAVDRYDAHLQSIRPELPEPVRQLLDGFYLHDAHVLSMGQRGDTFVISLQLDVPPNDLLLLTYSLTGAPELKKETFLWVKDTYPVLWMYDEIECVTEAKCRHFVHSILFSNGWEITLPFREVQISTAFPILPLPRSVKAVGTSVPAPQSA